MDHDTDTPSARHVVRIPGPRSAIEAQPEYVGLTLERRPAHEPQTIALDGWTTGLLASFLDAGAGHLRSAADRANDTAEGRHQSRVLAARAAAASAVSNWLAGAIEADDVAKAFAREGELPWHAVVADEPDAGEAAV